MMKRIRIAMSNENKADCNEHFRNYLHEPETAVQAVDKNRPVEVELSQLQL